MPLPYDLILTFAGTFTGFIRQFGKSLSNKQKILERFAFSDKNNKTAPSCCKVFTLVLQTIRRLVKDHRYDWRQSGYSVSFVYDLGAWCDNLGKEASEELS